MSQRYYKSAFDAFMCEVARTQKDNEIKVRILGEICNASAQLFHSGPNDKTLRLEWFEATENKFKLLAGISPDIKEIVSEAYERVAAAEVKTIDNERTLIIGD